MWGCVPEREGGAGTAGLYWTVGGTSRTVQLIFGCYARVLFLGTGAQLQLSSVTLVALTRQSDWLRIVYI